MTILLKTCAIKFLIKFNRRKFFLLKLYLLELYQCPRKNDVLRPLTECRIDKIEITHCRGFGKGGERRITQLGTYSLLKSTFPKPIGTVTNFPFIFDKANSVSNSANL